jgi:hypothetical protein
MAYVKVMASHKAIAALRYGEHEESVTRGAVNCECDTEVAIKQFKADRIMWNKDTGVEAHIIIQSFDGTECDAKTANEIGQELARRVAPNHRAMVYTHTESEGGNIHNHIVINSVNTETGKKLVSSGLLYRSREASNELTKERGLSVIEERKAELKYTQAEAGLNKKNAPIWKDAIRDAVDKARSESRDFASFSARLKEQNITVIDHGENRKYRLTYQDEEGHKARGAKLGAAYEWEGIHREFEKQRSNDIAIQSANIVGNINRDNQTTARTNNAINESSRAVAGVREARERARAEQLENARRAREAEREQERQRRTKAVLQQPVPKHNRSTKRDSGRGR